MASFDRIKPGDILWDVHREKMGNTTMSRQGCWRVEVVSVDREKRTAVVRWNSNPQQIYSEYSLGRLRRSRPGAKLAARKMEHGY
jgi:hypothetical protein